MDSIHRGGKIARVIPIGERRGRLVIIGEVVMKAASSGRRNRAFYPCICDCGKEVMVLRESLTIKHKKSCGCLASEIHSAVAKSLAKHNGSSTRLFYRWHNLRNRCENPKNPAYRHYGARGITVCEEWRNNFATFRDWAVSNGYKDGDDSWQIDRIDNNEGYSPENCRFVTRVVNCNNRRSNRHVTSCGEEKTIAEWAADSLCVVTAKTLCARIESGWTPERAITTPPKVNPLPGLR